MSPSAEKVLLEALDLPAELRAYIAEKLVESLDAGAADEISTAWKEEIRRRCASLEQGAAVLHSADQVYERIEASLT